MLWNNEQKLIEKRLFKGDTVYVIQSTAKFL